MVCCAESPSLSCVALGDEIGLCRRIYWSVLENTLSELREVSAEPLISARQRQRQKIDRSIYGDIVQFIDFTLVTATAVFVAYIYHVQVIDVVFDFERYSAAGIIGATALTALLRRDGYYEFDSLLSSSRAMRAVVSRWSLIILTLIALAYSLKVAESFSRAWLFTWSGVSLVSIISARIAAAAFLRRAVREGGVFSRRVAVVGATAVADRFIEEALQPEKAICVVGVYNSGAPDAGAASIHPVTGDLEALEAAARGGNIDDVVIAVPSAASDHMTGIINRLSALPVSIAICSNVHWLDHKGGEIVRIGGSPALTLYRRPLEGWGGLVKLLEDRILGTFLFLIAAPIMLVVAIGICLQGTGPILFTQKRHGFNQKVFRIYKFRTMTVAEDGDVVEQAKIGDARITRFGAFLRRYSIDELPQLFNVIKGDMSLVGPRPHALAHNDQYALTVENYSGRHKVKPGITGWAQVNGYRGETSENEMMAERVRCDLEYIDNWSIWFDAKILVLTVAAVLFPKNAH